MDDKNVIIMLLIIIIALLIIGFIVTINLKKLVVKTNNTNKATPNNKHYGNTPYTPIEGGGGSDNGTKL